MYDGSDYDDDDDDDDNDDNDDDMYDDSDGDDNNTECKIFNLNYIFDFKHVCFVDFPSSIYHMSMCFSNFIRKMLNSKTNEI